MVVANRIALPAEPPEEIWLMPWGEVQSSRGGFVVNDESRRAILERIDRQGVDLVIDYEHHTVGGEFAAPDGRARAAGWIRALTFVKQADGQTPGALRPGVWATVEWTPEAARMIRDKEYRYVSPVALVRDEDGVCIGLHSVALTNTPAIREAQPIVNKDGDSVDSKFEQARWFLNLEATATQEQIMSEMEKFLAQLREMAGAAADADQAAVTAAMKARLDEGRAALTAHKALRAAVCRAAALNENVADAAVLAACGDLRRPAAGGDAEIVALRTALEASNREMADLRAQHCALSQRMEAEEAQQRIDAAIAAGKLTPAMLDAGGANNWYRRLACRADDWSAWLASAPTVGPRPGRTAGPAPGAAGNDRAKIIAASAREFDAEPQARGLTSKGAWINDALRLAGLTPLSADEIKQVA